MIESLKKIKDLVEKMSVDTNKVFVKGNRSASIRARKNSQEVRDLVKVFRKEILDEMKRRDKLETKKVKNGATN
jgi:phosphate uptake regulator